MSSPVGRDPPGRGEWAIYLGELTPVWGGGAGPPRARVPLPLRASTAVRFSSRMPPALEPGSMMVLTRRARGGECL